jgi:YVTN family beta-propeller protein
MPAPDSIQIVFSIEDRIEQAFSGTIFLPTLHSTRLPFLDDIRLYQLGVDSDFDGVADSHDACPSVLAAGQDADGDGCLDPTATFHHVESWASSSLPLRYRMSQQRIPGISDLSDRNAILAAVNTWRNVPGADVRINTDLDTPQVAASATDGINLITFQDQSFAFSPSVLAVTPTLSATRRTFFGDEVVLPGQIVDADIVFNPTASFRTPTHTGAFDLQSVATHEFGHLLGLSHSGVATATMYFVQQPGTVASTLKNDDMAAVAAAYPGTTIGTNFGSIKGTVTRDTTGLPIPGALVTAVHLDVAGAVIDTAGSDYTREDGSYAMYRLPAGNYAVYVTPLDGLILNGLSPEFISGHLAAIAENNFDPEWYSAIETAHDDPTLKQALTLGAGTALTGINVITNLDTIPPAIVATSPANGSTGSAIDASVLVTFSEPVDVVSLQNAFKLRAQGSSSRLGGSGLLSNAGRTFLFTPDDALEFNSPYEIVFTTDLIDAKGVHLPSEFLSTFTTQPQPPVSISQVSPRSVRPGAIVTLTGAGFQSDGSDFIGIAGGGGLDSAVVLSHTPTTLTFAVPTVAPGSDSVFVISGGNTSNKLGITILAPVPQASPSQSGAPIPLAFSPTDVALSPDGFTAIAVGDGGLATINLNPVLPNLRTAVQRFTRAAKSIALSPNGLLGFVTQPLDSAVLVVDTSPISTGFGTVLHTIHIPGQPTSIVVDPAGRRAYTIEQATGLVFEMDVNPASTSANSLIRQYPPQLPFTGGLEIDPRGDRLYLTQLLQVITLTLRDSSVAVDLVGYPTFSSITVDPSATQLIYPVWNQLRLRSPSNAFTELGAPLGGFPNCALVSPQGQSAFVTNQTFNQLQVVNVDRSSATYHTAVAQVATGAGPVAVTSNSDGSLLAVANSGDHSISLYNVLTAGVPIIQRVVSDVALPGDAVAIQSPTSTVLTPTSQVDLGSGLLGLTNSIAGGGAFSVPALSQRATSVTVQQAGGARSTSLPFTVVDPISTFTPHLTSISVTPAPVGCGPGLMYGRLDMVRVSPDGRTVALARQSGSPCSSIIDFYDASDQGPGVLGNFIASTGQPMSIIRDIAFTPDGKHLWLIGEDLSSAIIDTDRSGAIFGSVVGAFGPPTVPSPAQFAADPLGRYMFASDLSVERVMFLAPGSGATVAIMPFTTPTRGLAASPDGRTLVVGLNGRAGFVDIAGLGILLFSPNHVPAGVADYFQNIAITTNGKRAVGLMNSGRIAVWNLDPAQNFIGTELFFGTPIPVELAPSSPVPGSDGHSVIFGCANSDSMVRLDVASGTPVATYSNINQRSPAIGRSPDGRRLWVAHNIVPGSAGIGNLKVVSLSPATQLSLVGGGDQSARAGSLLPLPIDVRVTDDLGHPQQGVAVHFATSSPSNGTLDGVAGRLSTHHLTDSNGEALVGWTLPAAGTQVTMVVTAEGVASAAPLVVHATLAVDDSQIEPVIVALGPPDGAAGLNAGTAVFARFNQRMQAASAASHLRLFMNGNPVTGTPSLSEQGRLVLFQPGAALQFSARCSLVVDAGMLDLDGQSLAQGGVSVFTVQAPPPVALNSLLPQAGPAGTAVVLNGTGFSATAAQNIVLFNGVLALPSDARLTSLVANAPLSASSGPVTVGVGNATSNALTFTVLPPNPDPGGILGDLAASQGIRDIAASPDGSRLYVTNPGSNTLTALDVNTATHLIDITVGSLPQSVAILPDGSRAYVANTGSNNLSVVDVMPGSATYHTVIGTIPVGSMPVDVQVGPVGPKIYVLNQGSNTLDEIDANPGNATFDQVVTTVSTGSGGKNVSISADGTRAYIAFGAGLLVIDLQSHSVVTTVSTGSGGKNVSISADGTLVLLLTENGELFVINTAAGPGQYQVVTTVSTGSGGKNVSISADGTLAYVTNEDDNTVQVFSIGTASSGSSTVLPGPAVRLTRVATFATGQGPGGIAMDPTGKTLVYVANEVSGTVTILGFPGGLPTVPVAFDFNPNSLNLKSVGKWVKGAIRPPAPYTASDIVLSSIRLNGVVPVDLSAAHSIDDSDSELIIRFLRSEVELVVETGDAVPVTVTGLIEGRNFSGRDTIRVTRGNVTSPNAGQVLAGHSTFNVTWTTPEGTHVQSVAILHSFDHGNNWTLDAQSLPNTGSYSWSVPDASTDSAKVAVVLVESTQPSGADSAGAESSEVSGTLAISEYFRIHGTTDVTPPPATLQFAPIRPNPARGAAVMRFGLPRRAKVDLELFDLQGRRTRVLISGEREPGWYEVRWNGQTDGGGGAAAGLYFARFRAEGREFKQRLIWLR